MNHSVDGKGKTGGAYLFGECDFLILRTTVVADALGRLNVGILEAELHVIEARLRQGLQAISTGENTRGNEIAIETGCMGVTDQLVQIAPHHRLTAGKVNLQGAKLGSLIDYTLPVGC